MAFCLADQILQFWHALEDLSQGFQFLPISLDLAAGPLSKELYTDLVSISGGIVFGHSHYFDE